MEVQCAVCSTTVDTKKQNVMVTTGWILEETAKMNDVNHEGSFPRVSMICPNCWKSVLKKKPQETNCFWVYNKDI